MLNYRHRATSKRQLQFVDVLPPTHYHRLVSDRAVPDLCRNQTIAAGFADHCGSRACSLVRTFGT
jgi:hypothetical protein